MTFIPAGSEMVFGFLSFFVLFASVFGKKDRRYDLGSLLDSDGIDEVHVYMFFGEVEASQWAYFELKAEGRLRIVLQSLRGDADLYLSYSKKYPGLDVSDHDMLSASCGIDFVDIPLFSKRPVYVGVYGHPSKPLSPYKLMLLVKQSNNTEFEPEINFQPEQIQSFLESDVANERAPGEVNSVFDFLILLLKVILEAIVEIAL